MEEDTSNWFLNQGRTEKLCWWYLGCCIVPETCKLLNESNAKSRKNACKTRIPQSCSSYLILPLHYPTSMLKHFSAEVSIQTCLQDLFQLGVLVWYLLQGSLHRNGTSPCSDLLFYACFISKDEMKDFSGDTPYLIMFGPDICGYQTKRVHVILKHGDKNHMIKNEIKCKTDQLTHVYTLHIKPDNTYRVCVDSGIKFRFYDHVIVMSWFFSAGFCNIEKRNMLWSELLSGKLQHCDSLTSLFGEIVMENVDLFCLDLAEKKTNLRTFQLW